MERFFKTRWRKTLVNLIRTWGLCRKCRRIDQVQGNLGLDTAALTQQPLHAPGLKRLFAHQGWWNARASNGTGPATVRALLHPWPAAMASPKRKHRTTAPMPVLRNATGVWPLILSKTLSGRTRRDVLASTGARYCSRSSWRSPGCTVRGRRKGIQRWRSGSTSKKR